MVWRLKCLSIAVCIVCVAGIPSLRSGQALPAIRGRDALDTAQAQPRSVEPENHQAQAATVLLEAFVVEVNLPALGDLGVSPIGWPPHSTSVENILTCLENGQASVIAGAKEAVQNQRDSKVRATRTTYVKRDVPPDTESWEWQGDVVLRPGEPAIAAATQDRQRGVFLVLTAHVQDR